MASLNSSHHADGGVLLYSGEIVLLYCDKVHCEIDGVGSATGRLFLTTHRTIFTAQPISQNPRLQSLAAPFYAMFDLGLEQPVFGANYIKGKVRTNASQNTSPLTQNQFSFKLKFNKGGATEYGRALSMAAKQASQVASQSGFNVYSFVSMPAAGQYYAAPSDIYQPNYPIGFVLPTQQFNEVPQTGTIYYQNAPPPYPGIVPAHQAQQPAAFAQVYPVPPVNCVYERNPYQGNYPPSGYPSYGSQAPPTAHYPAPPPQGGYTPGGSFGQGPPNYQSNTNYPVQPQQNTGYMPGSTSNNAYTPQYPSVPGQQPGGYTPQSNSTYPNIPTYEDATRKNK